MRFIANAGQVDPAVRFTVKRASHTIYFTKDEIIFASSPESRELDQRLYTRPGPVPHFQLSTRDAQRTARDPAVVRLRFRDANPHSTIEGLTSMRGVANFFLGNDPAKWRSNVPTYEAVAYRDLYPGIDLVYRGTEGHLKSEFLVAPGADPGVIQMTYSGVEALRLRADGALVIETPLGELVETTPLIYQEVEGARQAVPGGYVLSGEDQVGFQVQAYDPVRPLVIDPELTYSTYLGGDASDSGKGIAVDSVGNVYVTGYTQSSDFPTCNAIDTGPGSRDAFVTQIISASGVYTYGYSTYLGGGGDDEGYGIAVDSIGNAYVTGYTRSSDFPVRNAIQPDAGDTSSLDGDAFVTQIISVSGVYTLGYSTYLGGDGDDTGRGIAVPVGDAGNAYVTGDTGSGDLATTNAIDTILGGDYDAFVTQIVNVGGVYTYGYSTYLGGSGGDRGRGIAVDSAGNVYATGSTGSSDFPIRNAIQPVYGGGDAFVTQIISASGVYTYGYSTYLGGDSGDAGNGIAVDDAGNAYVTGSTESSNFPIRNAIQPVYKGSGPDAFVTQIISASGVYTYGYSTYLGGSSFEYGWGIAVDGAGSAHVTGQTESSDFPTHNAIQPDFGGGMFLPPDIFVTQITSVGGVYTYAHSTYLGGGGADLGYSIAVDDVGNAYVTGHAWGGFPIHNATQPGYGGGSIDAIVAKISADTTVPMVVAVAPGSGATNVALTAPVVITFSQPISISTLAYTVTPDPGGWSAVWSGGDTMVTLDHDSFTSQTTYTVTITAAADAAGNPLAGAPYIWYFSTVPYRLYLPLVMK